MPEPREPPADFLRENGYFPDGPFRYPTPKEVFLAAGVAERLNKAIGEESFRYVAKKAGLSPQTILNILNGKTWPDLRTIAKLEQALGVRLWGQEHTRRPAFYRRYYSWQ